MGIPLVSHCPDMGGLAVELPFEQERSKMLAHIPKLKEEGEN